MTGSVIMAYDPSRATGGAEVTVVTGSQFGVSAPSTPTTGGSTTTTTTPTVAAIAAPSPATSNLQPWDPRACPAGATPIAPVPNPT